jgi:hypothetical protein
LVILNSIEAVTVFSTQKISGTNAQIKAAVASIVSQVDSKKDITALLNKIKVSESTMRKNSIVPTNKNVDSVSISKTPKVCTLVKGKIIVKKSGICSINYVITTEDGDVFETTSSRKVKK